MLGTLHSRLVHSSTTTAWLGEGLATSSTISLCVDSVGLSNRQYIHCGVVVPVVDDTTNGAYPFANRQRQGVNDVATIVASLAGWKEAVNLDQVLLIPGAFVLEQLNELAHRGIAERLGQAVVMDHAPHVQVFDADHVEAAYQGGSSLVYVVEAGVCDAGVGAGDLEALTLAAVTTFLFSGQGFLRLGQLAKLLFEHPWVDDVLAVREGGEPVDTHVHADDVASFGQGMDGLVEHQGHEVPAISVLGYRHSGGGAREGARPVNIQAAKLGDGQVAVGGVPVERAGGILRRLRAVLFLKGRIRRALFKEVYEGGLQVAQHLLRGHRRNLVEPYSIRFLLELGQRRRRRLVVHPSAVMVGISTGTQRPVVNKTTCAKGTRQGAPLASGRVKAKLVAHLHNKRHIFVNVDCKQEKGARHLTSRMNTAVFVSRTR